MTAVKRNRLAINVTRDVRPCPVCGGTRQQYLFVVRGLPVAGCPGCGLISLNPPPKPEDLRSFYDNLPEHLDPRLIFTDSDTERDAAKRIIAMLRERAGASIERILVIAASPDHAFFAEARAQQLNVAGHASVADVETGQEIGALYDAVVVLHQLEKSADPAKFLDTLYAALRPDGTLLITTPSIASWPAEFFGHRWTEYRPENRFYFSANTLQSLLLKSGFRGIRTVDDRRRYSLKHVFERARTVPNTALTRLIRFGYHLTPRQLRPALKVRITSSAIIVAATRAERRARPLVSIVVPVYKERETFTHLMDALLAKEVPGIDREILIVESNSKDGTREAVLAYEQHPGVRVILEERARGKGHAVRTGFKEACGDILMIQDADLEYDLNDYDALLEPLIRHQELFVLGARHGGSWKMRQFADQASLSSMLNFGHVFFTWLMNVLFNQRMKDPFTMYKVFWRDCLHGLAFECNRFDFDHELVIKLCRKGYTPLEIPVNYQSRSFKEGKKVRMFRDPMTWIVVNFKLRFTPLYPRKPKETSTQF